MKKLRVGLDLRELTGNPAGKGLHLLHLLTCWQKRELELVAYIKKGTVLPDSVRTMLFQVVEVGGKGIFWHRAVGKKVKGDGVTVFLAGLSYQSAIWNQVPTITIIPDLIALVCKDVRQNYKAQLTENIFLGAMLKRTAGIICCSDWTAQDLKKVSPKTKKPVWVTKLAPEKHIPFSEVIPLSKRENTVLFVGTLEPRKNITRALEAFASLPEKIKAGTQFSFIGKNGWGSENYQQIAKDLGISDRVQFLGYVTTEERERLYAHAKVLFYPSLYEGFGLPVVEAMAHGTPVITSTRSSLPEVVADAGLLCDPLDVPMMTKALQRMLTDTDFWQEQHRKAFQRAQDFSWDDTAEATEKALREIAGPMYLKSE